MVITSKAIQRFIPSYTICSLICIGILCFVAPAHAAPKPYVPNQLSPWVDWVKARHPGINCAQTDAGDACIWPGTLSLKLSDTGGDFIFSVKVDKDGLAVPIPGSKRSWPLDLLVRGEDGLTLSNEKVVVLEREERPELLLNGGSYTISGKFRWEAMPEMIMVPVNAALITLSLNNNAVLNPRFGDAGELWLKDNQENGTVEEDQVKITINRLLTDQVPFKILTIIELRVSGKAREFALGQLLVGGSTPVAVTSELPISFDPAYNATVKVRPGVHSITVEALLSAPPESLSPTVNKTEGWPNNEVWAWQPDELLRSVELEGAPAIDPAQTTLPDEWKNFSTYAIAPETKLQFRQTRRGQTDIAPNSLNLVRNIWLDFDGKGATVSDSLSGTMHQGWRVNASPDLELGHVVIGGQDQLITSDPGSQDEENSEQTKGLHGVEVRTENVFLQAESRINHTIEQLNAVGWNHDVGSLDITLNLPPGWSLFDATGVDNVENTWLGSWTLFDCFVVLILVVAGCKLFGNAVGIALGVAAVLSHGIYDSPLQIWFHLFACVALVRVLPSGKFKKFIWLYFGLALAALCIFIFAFAAREIREAIYPQLEAARRGYYMQPVAPAAYRSDESFSEAGGNSMDMAMENALQEAAPQSLAMGTMKSVAPKERRYKAAKNSLQQNDPNAQLQTGPGLPTWSWNSWQLSWRSPVESNHKIQLKLLSPTHKRILACLRIVLFVFVLISLIKNIRSFPLPKRFSDKPATDLAGALLIAGLTSATLLGATTVRADDFPSGEMKEFIARLKSGLSKTSGGR